MTLLEDRKTQIAAKSIGTETSIPKTGNILTSESSPIPIETLVNELNTSIPSTRWLQRLIQSRQAVSLHLLNSEPITGTLKWLDPDCLCITDNAGTEILIWRHSLVSIRPA